MEFSKLFVEFLCILGRHLYGGKSRGKVVGNPVFQGQGVANGGDNAQSGPAATSLFVGHPNGTIVHRVGIPITWIQ